MKKVEAIIRAEAFINLREALSTRGFSGLTVSEAAGCGKQKGNRGYSGATNSKSSWSPGSKLKWLLMMNK